MSSRCIEMAVKPVEKSLTELRDGIEWLDKEGTRGEYFSIIGDAVIKRFETLFEYCWKLLKVAVEHQGVEAPGPRPAIQEAVRFGWIRDPEFWALALDARNGSVHDYFGITREEYLKIIRKFVVETEQLLERVPT